MTRRSFLTRFVYIQVLSSFLSSASSPSLPFRRYVRFSSVALDPPPLLLFPLSFCCSEIVVSTRPHSTQTCQPLLFELFGFRPAAVLCKLPLTRRGPIAHHPLPWVLRGPSSVGAVLVFPTEDLRETQFPLFRFFSTLFGARTQ